MISNNIMLDPSLFMDRRVGRTGEEHVINRLGRKTSELSFLDFYIPETFDRIVFGDDVEVAWNSVTEFFATQGDFPDRDTLQHKLQNYVNYNTFSLSEPPSNSENKLQGDIYELNEGRYLDERNRIHAELSLEADETELISQIITEELAFSNEMSPILSRLKKTFQRMAASAQSVVTLSEQYASNTAEHVKNFLKSELPGYRRELSPLEALEVACKYKKMDFDIAKQQLSLYRDALKDEIPLVRWIATSHGMFYFSYVYNQLGPLSGNLSSDLPVLANAGFTLLLLDP